MRALVLAVLLASAPSSVQQARELAKDRAWEELYLAFAAAAPEKYEAKDRRELSKLLAQGATALEGSDAVMAFSLAERAVAFEETPEVLLLWVRTARASEQRGTAESALRRGVKRFPGHAGLRLELGKQHLQDKDHAAAVQALEQVPAKSPEHAEAKLLLDKARAQLAEEREAKQAARAVERRFDGSPSERAKEGAKEGTKTAEARGGPAQTQGMTRPSGLSYESGIGPGGMRTRSNRRFVFRYFNNARDFGQRADYEGRVAEALEEAYHFTRRILGEARESPVDVILYTREEFATHHGAALAQAAAGVYRDNAILMNDAGEMTRRIRSTVVHEYVHAAVDELAGGSAQNVPIWMNEGIAEYVEWRYLGHDAPPPAEAVLLRGAALSGALPPLEAMANRSLISMGGDPRLAYGTSASAVRLLIRKGGMNRFVEFLKEVGRGRALEEALQDRYDRTLARLNEEVADELKSR